jgi:hypothetical protein
MLFSGTAPSLGQQSTSPPADTGPASLEVNHTDPLQFTDELPTLRYDGLPDAPSSRRSASVNAKSMNFEDRLHVYGEAVLRPYTVISPGFGFSFARWQNSPQEWFQSGAPYGNMSNHISTHAVAASIQASLAAFDGEDPRYHPSEESGLWNRTRHVFLESFTSQTVDGRRMPAFSRFAGAYGAAFLSCAQYPDGRVDPNFALRRGSSVFATGIGLQLMQEFVPQKYLRRFGLADRTRP